jgi:hypothetical protein
LRPRNIHTKRFICAFHIWRGAELPRSWTAPFSNGGYYHVIFSMTNHSHSRTALHIPCISIRIPNTYPKVYTIAAFYSWIPGMDVACLWRSPTWEIPNNGGFLIIPSECKQRHRHHHQTTKAGAPFDSRSQGRRSYRPAVSTALWR